MSERELTFTMFIIHALAKDWGKTSPEVYTILNTTQILDEYILKCYDVLHTLGEKYLIEDITELVLEKGVVL